MYDVSVGAITSGGTLKPGQNENVLEFTKSLEEGWVRVFLDFSKPGDMSLLVHDPYGGSYGSDSNREDELLLIQAGLSGDFRVEVINESGKDMPVTITVQVVTTPF